MGTPTPSLTRALRGFWTRRSALWAAAIALPLAGGCAANFSAQTNQPYQPAIGISDRSGDVYSINTLVVGDAHGNGTVVAVLINQASTTDSLVDFSAEDADAGGLETSQPAAGGVSLPSQAPAKLPDDGALQLTGDVVQPGAVVTLTFTFQNAAPITIEAPVVRQTDTYAFVQVGPIEKTPAPTPTSPTSS
ncbi:MAG: hypothetical protein ABJA81_02040 [Nocardioidaceae bacterium]